MLNSNLKKNLSDRYRILEKTSKHNAEVHDFLATRIESLNKIMLNKDNNFKIRVNIFTKKEESSQNQKIHVDIGLKDDIYVNIGSKEEQKKTAIDLETPV
ncbi:MAG: hypothetical protein LEGION0398_MBIBDBAK_01038 [Legionellaceae bacterium]